MVSTVGKFRHVNEYGYTEYLDSLPVRDCGCDICIAAINRQANQSSGDNQAGHAGRIAKGIVSASIALHGAVAHPQQDSTTTQQHWGQSSEMREGEREGSDVRGATRDKGYRAGGSGQH